MNVDDLKLPESIKCLLRTFRKCRNPEFQQWIKDYTYPYMTKMVEEGDKNPSRILYLTNTNAINAGFCAMIVQTLNILAFVDRMKLEPVIEWNKAYYFVDADEDTVGSTFDYYFDQPSGIGVFEAKSSKNIVHGREVDGYISTNGLNYTRTDEELKKRAKLYHKYFHLNEETAKKLEADQLWTITEPHTTVLGVHVRGGDFKKNLKGHPRFVTPYQFLEQAKKLDSSQKYTYVFLATDDEEAVEIFRNYFKERLCYYTDTARSSDDNGVHKLAIKSGKELGYEVLRDVFTLAKCTDFIGGFSNVAHVARLEKLRSGVDFINVEYVENGVNK